MPKAIFESRYFKNQTHVLNHLEYLDKQSTLFSGVQDEPLEDALVAAEESTATKWRFVYSLKSEDAERLAIDRDYMKQLVQSQKAIWAAAYNIPLERLHLFASYHPMTHHPHLHVVMFGETGSDGFVVKQENQELGEAFKRCREKTKSAITGEIFKSDMEPVYSKKSETRTIANLQLEKMLQELGRNTHPIKKEWITELEAIGKELQQCPGKHVYGYLPPQLKKQVDAFLQQVFEQDPTLAATLAAYKSSQRKIITELYVKKSVTIAEKMAAFNEAFYHPKKGEDTQRHNLIIKAAEELAGQYKLKPDNRAAPSERYIEKTASLAEEQALVKGNESKERYMKKSETLPAETKTAKRKFTSEPAKAESGNTQAPSTARPSYTDKTPSAAVRRLLFALARNCNNQQQRTNNQQRSRSQSKAQKFRKRKRHQTYREQLDSPER